MRHKHPENCKEKRNTKIGVLTSLTPAAPSAASHVHTASVLTHFAPSLCILRVSPSFFFLPGALRAPFFSFCGARFARAAKIFFCKKNRLARGSQLYFLMGGGGSPPRPAAVTYPSIPSPCHLQKFVSHPSPIPPLLKRSPGRWACGWKI